MTAAQAAENHKDEWGVTLFSSSSVNVSVVR